MTAIAVADYNEAIQNRSKRYAHAYNGRGNAWKQQKGLRQGRRRLQRGHQDRSWQRLPRTAAAAGPGGTKGLRRRPSPTTTRPSGSIQPTLTRTTAVANAWSNKKDYDAGRRLQTRPSDSKFRDGLSTTALGLAEQEGLRQGRRRLPTRPIRIDPSIRSRVNGPYASGPSNKKDLMMLLPSLDYNEAIKTRSEFRDSVYNNRGVPWAFGGTYEGGVGLRQGRRPDFERRGGHRGRKP